MTKPLIEVADAQTIVLGHSPALAPLKMALTMASLGQVLAEDLFADLDSPPFDKAMMDGYALRSKDLAKGPIELRIVEEIAAGAMPTKTVGAGEAAAIYTGAPIPLGVDAVVMKEQCVRVGSDRVLVKESPVTAGRHILTRGREMKVGDVILSTGTVLTPAALGLTAAIGVTQPRVFPAPRVAILATGNELVEPSQIPGPGQIRNSNGPMLQALSAKAGGVPKYLGIAGDNELSLKTLIREGLESSDVLLLAGGVSAGAFDLVPGVLTALGVTTHFHHVRLKPGKPLLFGTMGVKLVFGLPGNPVSAFVGFELFVKPALRSLSGHAQPLQQSLRLPIVEPLTATNDRPTYYPAKRIDLTVMPLPWFGSADLRVLLQSDCLLALPAGVVQLNARDSVEVIPL